MAESKLASRAKAKDDDLDAAFVLKTQQQMLEMRQGYERLKRQVRSHCRYLFEFEEYFSLLGGRNCLFIDSISVLCPGRLRERVLFKLVGEDGDEVIGGESERRKVGAV